MLRHMPRILPGVLLLIALSVWSIPQLAARPTEQPHELLIDAVVRPVEDRALGFVIDGLVSDVLVRQGERVTAGQTLARIDASEIDAQVALSRIRAESDLNIRASEAALGLARNELARRRQAVAEGAVTEFELERAQLEVSQADLRLQLARQQRNEAELELALAEARRTRYDLTAPIDAVVERILIKPGELVERSRPVLRIVSIDELEVEAAVPLDATLALNPGDTLEVRIRSERMLARTGTITQLAAVADAASGTRLVRIRLPNPDAFPAGSQAVVVVPITR
ncbi:MAG: efflux RND transporter periplasmic adaptor subunit [Phycisphaeraceae bacterium]|nr:MAG: efflux RND transporter periplasmic adaptor subunit [Phycisphaeraceae bacterium]